jgi:aryl-alcohol dehydrogenase-like predicted oxidoreductase
MQYGSLPGIKKPISRLVQGTASFPGGTEHRIPEVLDLALEHGYNTFDTAHVYGPVKEGLIGQWVRDRGVQDKVVILAKGAHHNKERRRVTAEDIQSDMNDTMERMQLDYLDLYVLHRDDPSVPVGPIVEALNEHVKAGRIGAFGGSNWSHDRIKAANDYAAEHNLIPFAISSPNFSLAEMVEPPWEECISISGEQGREARAYYESVRDSVALMPWSSLAGGFFSGRFTRENEQEMKSHGGFDDMAVRCYGSEANYRRLDRTRELAEKKGRTVPEVALAFVLNQPLNVFPLVFCNDDAQFKSNNAAVDLKLTAQEVEYLDLRADSAE